MLMRFLVLPILCILSAFASSGSGPGASNAVDLTDAYDLIENVASVAKLRDAGQDRVQIAVLFEEWIINARNISKDQFLELVNNGNKHALNILEIVAQVLSKKNRPLGFKEQIIPSANGLYKDVYGRDFGSSSGTGKSSFSASNSPKKSTSSADVDTKSGLPHPVYTGKVYDKNLSLTDRAIDLVDNVEQYAKNKGENPWDALLRSPGENAPQELAAYFQDLIVNRRSISKDQFLQLYNARDEDAQKIIETIAKVLSGKLKIGSFHIHIRLPADALYKKLHGRNYVYSGSTSSKQSTASVDGKGKSSGKATAQGAQDSMSPLFVDRALEIVKNVETLSKDVDFLDSLREANPDFTGELAVFFKEQVIEKRAITKDQFLEAYNDGDEHARQIITVIAQVLSGELQIGLYHIRTNQSADTLYKKVHGRDYEHLLPKKVESSTLSSQEFDDEFSDSPRDRKAPDTGATQETQGRKASKKSSEERERTGPGTAHYFRKKLLTFGAVSGLLGVVGYLVYKNYFQEEKPAKDE